MRRRRGRPGWIGGGQPYVRDPKGTFTGATRSPYAAATALPVDAVDTGVRRDGAVLLLARDRSAVFVVRPDGVERLPREKGERGYCLRAG